MVLLLLKIIQMENNKRLFMRHPTSVPIEVLHLEKDVAIKKSLKNISLGGLAFTCDKHWDVGSLIQIRIPFVIPPFEVTGKVAWCQPQKDDYFDVGVEFMELHDAFRVRMVEQACQIEDYKKRLERQGRKISIEEAAMEWIRLYAAEFPPLEAFTA